VLRSKRYTGPNNIMAETLAVYLHSKYGVKEQQVWGGVGMYLPHCVGRGIMAAYLKEYGVGAGWDAVRGHIHTIFPCLVWVVGDTPVVQGIDAGCVPALALKALQSSMCTAAPCAHYGFPSTCSPALKAPRTLSIVTAQAD
jgi:hypothetical protein